MSNYIKLKPTKRLIELVAQRQGIPVVEVKRMLKRGRDWIVFYHGSNGPQVWLLGWL